MQLRQPKSVVEVIQVFFCSVASILAESIQEYKDFSNLTEVQSSLVPMQALPAYSRSGVGEPGNEAKYNLHDALCGTSDATVDTNSLLVTSGSLR